MGIKRIFHVNVNCTNKQDSIKFYQDCLGLNATPVTTPGHLKESHDAAVRKIFGFEHDAEVDFDAHFLTGNEAEDATFIDFIQWKATGNAQPLSSLSHLGIARIAFAVEDMDAMYNTLVRNGVECISEPKTLVAESGDEFQVVLFRDPDGTVLEFVQTPPAGHDIRPGIQRVFHFNVNCSDLSRSLNFYRDLLGMNLVLRAEFNDDADLGAALGFDCSADGVACLLGTEAGNEHTLIDLVQWNQPEPVGKPIEDVRQAGMPRMAFLVDNLDEMYEKLSSKGVNFISEPVTFQFDPPLGGIRAVCFYDPDGTILEFLELDYKD